VWRELSADLAAIRERDPACRSALEAWLCYPGLHALLVHRVAHRLWRARLHLLARLLSQLARFFTGVEIHPGARIGQGFFIDHGMGVVIGETAEIGDGVTLYQGVTLGGTGKERGKRHPTLGNGVMVGVGAKILGNVTVGDNSRIGAGAVVVDSVPPNCTVVGIPGRVVRRDGRRVAPAAELEHGDLPDPVAAEVRALTLRLRALERRVQELEEAVSRGPSASRAAACCGVRGEG
jgi:serine O-acetyltransferase